MEYINVHAAVSKAYQHSQSSKASPPGAPQISSGLAGGMIAFIVILALVEIGLGIWAIIALVRFWRFMPTLAAVASLLLLLFGFVPFSLIVTYVSKRV